MYTPVNESQCQAPAPTQNQREFEQNTVYAVVNQCDTVDMSGVRVHWAEWDTPTL
jgi:hypothetical protein